MSEYKEENFLTEMIEISLSKIKGLSDSDTIIGEPISSPGGSTIIPVSKVSVGFVVGGGQYSSNKKRLPFPLTGASGGGVSVSPIGFIVETNEEVRFVDIENKNAYQTLVNLANKVLSKVEKTEDSDESKS